MRRPLACFLTARIHPVRDERDSQYTAYVQSKDPDHCPLLSQPRGSLTVTPTLYLLYTTPSSCPQSLPPIVIPRSSQHRRTPKPASPLLSIPWFSCVDQAPQEQVSAVSCPSLASAPLWPKGRTLRKRLTRGSQSFHCSAVQLAFLTLTCSPDIHEKEQQLPGLESERKERTQIPSALQSVIYWTVSHLL